VFERSDRYLGLGCIVVSIVGFMSASKWKVLFATDPAGPGAIPKILCGGILIVGVILIAGSVFMKQKEGAAAPFCTAKELRLTLAMTASCLLYILLLSRIGYLLATPLLVAAILLIVGLRTPRVILMVSVLGTIVLFLIFYSLLKVNLPLGFMRELIGGLPLRW